MAGSSLKPSLKHSPPLLNGWIYVGLSALCVSSIFCFMLKFLVMQKRATIIGQRWLPFERSAYKVGPQLVSGNSDFRRNLDSQAEKGGLLCLMWSVLSPDVLLGVWNFGTCQARVLVPPAPSKNPGHCVSQVLPCLLDNPSALLSLWRGLSMSCVDLLGEDLGSLCLVSLTLHPMHLFPLAILLWILLL